MQVGGSTVNRREILEAAIAATHRGTYSEPEDCFAKIAGLWNAWMKARKPGPITGVDVAVMLGLMKIGRLASDPTHIDSWVDLAGYAACGAEITTNGKGR
jgi:hypothetical protein